jgi:kynurenine formamidase
MLHDYRKRASQTCWTKGKSEHTGTNIDAPVHFYKNQTTVDKIPPESLIGEAIVVDITEQAMKEPDYKLTVNDLKNWDMAASCFF